jgi:Zn-dependent metalloprotease
VADWDAVSYDPTAPHCLRRVDTNMKISDITDPTRIHSNGRIWSRALWDIRGALGNVKADTIILEAQFRFAPDTTFAAAAQHTVDTAQSLYGKAAAKAVLKAFQDREILP